MGSLDGVPTMAILEKHGVDTRIWGAYCSYDYRPYGGESWQEVEARLATFLDMLKSEYQGKTVVVATSGGIIRMAHKLLLAHVAPNVYPKVRVANGSISEFHIGA
jgi:broad specificity phosphatase PhoE